MLTKDDMKLTEDFANISDIDYVTYYENTPKKFARLVQTYAGSAPKGVRHFTEAMRVWLNKKIFIVAGESSGDQHAAKYVNAHRQLDPNAETTMRGVSPSFVLVYL